MVGRRRHDPEVPVVRRVARDGAAGLVVATLVLALTVSAVLQAEPPLVEPAAYTVRFPAPAEHLATIEARFPRTARRASR
jgi:acyl dehydratase